MTRQFSHELLEGVLGRRKLVLTASLLVSLLGFLFWLSMPRQEDPSMPDYWGQVVVAWPGADALTVEQQLLDPVERRLAKVEDLAEIESTAYAGLAHLELELRDGVSDPATVWDEVRRALESAESDLPRGASRPILDDDLQAQESVVVALTGDIGLLELQKVAESLEDALLDLPLVTDVRRLADPGEQVTIAIDDQVLASLGLSTDAVLQQLRGRMLTLPGGSLQVGDYSLTLRPASEFQTIEEIRSTPLILGDGSAVPLGSIATIDLEPRHPVSARMTYQGLPSVGLGVVPRDGANVVDFGESVRGVIEDHRSASSAIEFHEVIYQPNRVDGRLSDLANSLLLGILIVAGVLLWAMGPRLGLLVASVVPLVVLSSLAVYALVGGRLQQISVAAFVIALGMLVDNAIVMAESMQWRIDRGTEPLRAAVESVKELSLPLLAATATTMAVFVPMLLSKGATAEFTRSIPVVVMITLTMSCVYALLVTPAVAASVLRPRVVSVADSQPLARLASWVVRRRRLILAGAVGALLLAVLASGGVRQEFFPDSDRNQFLVEIELAEGSHLDATSRAAGVVESHLLAREEVQGVLTMVGRTLPHFYYNLSQIPWSPHLAQLVVETRDIDSVAVEIDSLRNWARRAHPELQLVVRALEQGPPVLAPVELRLYGDDLAALGEAAEKVAGLLHETAGTADIRHDLGPGGPMLRLAIDDAVAARRGIDRRTIANSLFGRTRGLPLGQFRWGDDPVPVLLRAPEGEDLGLDELPGLDVRGIGGDFVPLAQVIRSELEWAPAAVHHRDRRRVVRVLSQLQPGFSYSDVLSVVEARVVSTELPQGVTWEVGGAAEGSGEANEAMLRTLPVGLLLLIGILMAEFNSFRRLAIILVTVPLAAAGVVPGLLLADQPFGFMSFLGIIALVGVVVNNAIVLLDLVESERRRGSSVVEAVSEAVRRRTRPILLTSGTTVAGLLPLTLSGTTLWPPLAWAMISGLIASTGLSLAVVPALYLTLFKDDSVEKAGSGDLLGPRLSQVALIAGLWLVPGSLFAAQATPWTLERVVAVAASRPAMEASQDRERAASEQHLAEEHSRRRPSLDASFRVGEQDRDLTLETPVGSFPLGASRSETATLALSQPLVDPARKPALQAANRAELAVHKSERWHRSDLVLEAIDALLRLHEIDALLESDAQLVTGLERALAETEARVAAGRQLDVEALKIDLALLQVKRRTDAQKRSRRVAARDLARVLGLDPVAESFHSLAGLEEAAPTEADLAALPPLEELVPLSLESRPDLASSELALESETAELEVARRSRLPRVDVQLAGQWDSGTPFAEDRWIEGAVLLRWTPHRAGRGRRLAAQAAQLSSRRALHQETRALATVEVAVEFARLETATEDRQVAQRGLDLAQETARVETLRYEAGRVTANDWLEAESALARRRAATVLARVDQIRAWNALQRLWVQVD